MLFLFVLYFHVGGHPQSNTQNFANVSPPLPLYELLNNKITSVKHVCHFSLITLTRPPSFCAYFMDVSSCLAGITLPLYFLVRCH